jgi:hypothetical protein
MCDYYQEQLYRYRKLSGRNECRKKDTNLNVSPSLVGRKKHVLKIISSCIYRQGSIVWTYVFLDIL